MPNVAFAFTGARTIKLRRRNFLAELRRLLRVASKGTYIAQYDVDVVSELAGVGHYVEAPNVEYVMLNP